MGKDEFFLQVAYGLSGCQLVEQELKLYITEVLDLVRKWIAGRITFKLSGRITRIRHWSSSLKHSENTAITRHRSVSSRNSRRSETS